MKSLLITSDFPPILGGQSALFAQLWKSLPEGRGLVLAPHTSNGREIDSQFPFPVRRIHLPLGDSLREKSSKVARLFREARSFCRESSVERIYCGQVFTAGMVGYLLLKKLGIPYCPFVCGADLMEYQHHPLYSRLLKRIFHYADGVFVISIFTAKLVADFGVPWEKIKLLHPYIDTGFYQGEDRSEELRRRLGLEGKRVLLTMARLVERKGIDIVLRVLPGIVKDVPDLHYLVVGEGPDRARLQKMCKDLGLQSHVTFAGVVPMEDIPDYYRLCESFIMVSRTLDSGNVEGFGIVYIEANAAGKPVIGGKSGGVPDAVVDGVTGLLVEPLDEEAVAGAIRTLCQDEELRARMGEMGRIRAVAEFDWRNNQQKICRALGV